MCWYWNSRKNTKRKNKYRLVIDRVTEISIYFFKKNKKSVDKRKEVLYNSINILKEGGKNMVDEKLANDLLQYRAKYNLTQKELAERIGKISNHTIGDIENKKDNIRAITIARVKLFLEDEGE